MNGIFWGILLQSLSLNVLYLNYILPAAGAMVLYLHLRKFSQVNEAFRKAFRFSAALVLYEVIFFGVNGTRFVTEDHVLLALFVLGTVLQVAILLLLQSALTLEYEKEEIKKGRSHWLIWLAVWKIAIYVVQFSNLDVVGLWAALIILIVILIGVYRFLLDAEKRLLSERLMQDAPARGRRPLGVCTAYACAILLAIIGGMFFGQPGAPELTPLEKANYEDLVKRGMPQEVASCLSEEDIDNLGGARSFQQLKPYSQFGDADTKVVAVSGMTDYGQFVTVVWFSRKNEKRFSRDVLTIQGEVSSVYKGRIIYTREDGSKMARDIDVSEIGNLQIPEYADEFYEEYFPGAYLEIPALRSAKKISGYLLFDAGQYMEDDEGDLSEEVGGQIDAAWYGLKRLQFPYLSVPQALDRQAYSSYAGYFYALDENFYDIETWDDSE